ncbi:CHAT domain-containing protein [Cellulomonas massiliensis]|uniref:CHAT domain-containing protein n=1 Tax=Cellulomonas massiliensis TaxID=1465811 RepID=UPI001C9BF7B7|nr:CHAT domain-containing protein [Cellulomonas massiliensis]
MHSRPDRPVQDRSDSQEQRHAALIRARSLFDVVAADPRAGAPRAAALVEAARADADAELEAWALRALAWSYRARWDHAEAERLLSRALRLGRRNGWGGLVAQVLVARQAVRQETGRVAAARRDLDAALEAVLHAQDVAAPERLAVEIHIRLQRATADANAGRRDRAEARYRQLLPYRDRLTETDRYKLLNNLGLMVAQRGAYAAGLRLVSEAAEIAERLGPAAWAPVLQTRAWILVQAGRLVPGMREFERAERAYEAGDVPLAEYYAEYADTLADLRLLPEASRAADRAVDECERAGVPFIGAEARLRAAQVRVLDGDQAGALAHAEAAARAFEAQRRTGWRDRALLVAAEARALDAFADADEVEAARRAAARLQRSGNVPSAVQAHLVAGRVALQAGLLPVAARELGAARRLSQRGSVLTRIRGRLAGALAGRAAGDPRAALADCRAGLRDLAAHRSSLPTMELRALASGHGAELGEIGLGVLLRDGRPARVLDWMERTRAAALLGAPAPATGQDDEASTAEAVLEVSGVRAAELARPAAQPRDQQWLHEAPVSAPTLVPAPPTSSELRAALDGRVLVEYGRCEGRLVAVVLDRAPRLVDVGPERVAVEHLRALLFALRRLANPRSTATAAAARLSAEQRIRALRRALVEPLGVDPGRELVVVPAGPLHGVPWSALADAPVAVAPSAGAWLRTTRAPVRDGVVLVAGPGLAGAHEEVAALRELHPGAVVLEPPESAAMTVARASVRADLTHLAAHGSARADNPMFSSVLLADGPVTVQELQQTTVAPRRLVLASCHSGADVAYAGGETLGFVSAMLAQGTAGVVASIAAVPDVEAVDLMVALHTHLRRGLTMARALHAARAQIDRGTPGGFVNWCTFSAHGAA